MINYIYISLCAEAARGPLMKKRSAMYVTVAPTILTNFCDSMVQQRPIFVGGELHKATLTLFRVMLLDALSNYTFMV